MTHTKAWVRIFDYTDTAPFERFGRLNLETIVALRLDRNDGVNAFFLATREHQHDLTACMLHLGTNPMETSVMNEYIDRLILRYEEIRQPLFHMKGTHLAKYVYHELRNYPCA